MDVIGTILFDADGVVQRAPAGWLDRLVSRIGLTDIEPREVLDAIFAAERPALTGAGDFRAAIAELLTEWDRSDRLDAVLRAWLKIEVDDAVLAIVAQLRSDGIRCCLATNQHAVRAEYMRSLYDGHFDDQFYSCDVGALKPDSAYFSAVLERLDVPAQQVVFIDDTAANVATARQMGMDARLYTGPDALLTTMR